MKKILFLPIIVFGLLLTSCTTTKSYMSINTYKNKVNLLKDYYTENGFHLNGAASNEDNSLIFSGTLFINNSATPIFKNKSLIKDTYKFKNDNGDYVNFTLGYKIGSFETYAPGGNRERTFEHEIIYSEVCDCETNDYKQYEKLCKNENLIDFNNLNKNDKIIIPDTSTNIAIGVFGLGGCLLTFLILSRLH